MAFFSRNGSRKQADSNRKRRHSLNAWLLYLGIASMGLSGVTFSKYSTTITGTITVQVAQSFSTVFLDGDDNVLGESLVYEGQYVTEVPECPEREVTDSVPLVGQLSVLALDDNSDADIYRVFLGWTLDGETLVDPTEIEVYEDLKFVAVYEYTQELAPEAASPSEAEKVEAGTVPGGGQGGGSGAGGSEAGLENAGQADGNADGGKDPTLDGTPGDPTENNGPI